MEFDESSALYTFMINFSYYFCFASDRRVCISIMRRTRSKTQSKRKPITQMTAANSSLSAKYDYKPMVWEPPAINAKHLQKLNDDSVLMETDRNDLALVSAPIVTCKSNDITMKDVIERLSTDEKMELQTSQPLFGSDTEDFECLILSQTDTTEHSIEAKLEKIDANAVLPKSNNCAGPNNLPEEQLLEENVIGDINTTDHLPIKKRMKRLNSAPLTQLMLQLTGNILDEDYATKLCRLKTVDEMINLCAEQTQRVDQLMVDLFAMSKTTANLLDKLNISIDEL